jgi:hypothetical protein
VTDDCRFCSEASVLCRLAFHPRGNAGAAAEAEMKAHFADIEKVMEEVKADIVIMKSDIQKKSSTHLYGAPHAPTRPDAATTAELNAQKKQLQAVEKKMDEAKVEIVRLTSVSQQLDTRLDTL